MLIGRDPFIFSIVLELVKEWNVCNDKYDYSFCNGIMQFSLMGKVFPYKELYNITLSCTVYELIENLRNIPVDDEIYQECDTEKALKQMYSLVYTDDESENFRYKIAPQEFFDKNNDIFGVRSSKEQTVRIIAAKSSYDKKTGITKPVSEILQTYISVPYLEDVIQGLENSMKQNQNRPSESLINNDTANDISKDEAAHIRRKPMNKTIELIQEKLGELYRLCPPLEEPQLSLAETMLPNDLLEILKISNGILELMTHPKVDDGQPFVIGSIVYSFDDILFESKEFAELYGMEGVVLAGNGEGGYYIIQPDGTVYLYECPGEDGYCYAQNINEYISRFYKKHD